MHHPTQFQTMARTREADRMREAQAHRAAKQAKAAQAAGSGWMVRLVVAFARNVARLNPFGQVKPWPSDGRRLQPKADAQKQE